METTIALLLCMCFSQGFNHVNKVFILALIVFLFMLLVFICLIMCVEKLSGCFFLGAGRRHLLHA